MDDRIVSVWQYSTISPYCFWHCLYGDRTAPAPPVPTDGTLEQLKAGRLYVKFASGREDVLPVNPCK